MGFFLVFSAIGHLLVMLARGASLLVLAATNPIAAAGLVWEGGRSWFWKAFRWFHAAAFTPVIMMLMLGLGVQATSHVALSTTDSLQKAIGTAVPGVMLILVGCFAPLALFKLLAFVDPGTSSGAAMRAGLAAQGGLRACCAAEPATPPRTPPRAVSPAAAPRGRPPRRPPPTSGSPSPPAGSWVPSARSARRSLREPVSPPASAPGPPPSART